MQALWRKMLFEGTEEIPVYYYKGKGKEIHIKISKDKIIAPAFE